VNRCILDGLVAEPQPDLIPDPHVGPIQRAVIRRADLLGDMLMADFKIL
jgi:hypothetical protein